MLPNPEIDKLIQIAEDTVQMYLEKKTLTVDEEVQLLASAYTILFLKTVDHHPAGILARAHAVLQKCFEKTGDSNYSKKHRVMEDAYRKL
jgi:hypothetical protein